MSIIERAVKKLDTKSDSEKNQSLTTDTASSGVRLSEKVAVDESASEGKSSVDNMVHIPFTRLSSLGMVTPNAPSAPIAEEFRSIKRPLLLNIDGKGAAKVDHANLIMVASALSGEGKTFSAVNLAMSIALEQGKSVLFVDADVSKAAAGSLLGVPDKAPGLIDLLENKGLAFHDVVLKCNIPNLRILPAGNLHQRSTELLASDNMRALMLEISERYSDRVIVFDSPPLLLTTESRVLANFMGQIVFIVSAENTSQEAVVEALQYLNSDSIVGMVLNKAQRQSVGKYGYGYGYGGRQSESQSVTLE
jgi:protein-tyrosine kinase